MSNLHVPFLTQADKVAVANNWPYAYACGYCDGKRDKARGIKPAIPQDERSDYASGYWRGLKS